MTNLFEFLRKNDMYLHEQRIKDGYVVIPYPIRKYFNYNEYIHKTEIELLHNLINSVKNN